MRFVGAPEGQQVSIASGPFSEDQAIVGRHLWVIGPDQVPYALEACSFGKSLESAVIKHTNLTGGGSAHCGGELWFRHDSKIVINGASGRYGPTDLEALMSAARAFRDCGYEVGVVGWSLRDKPLEFVTSEGQLTWI